MQTLGPLCDMGKTHISEHKSIFLDPQIKIIDIGKQD